MRAGGLGCYVLVTGIELAAEILLFNCRRLCVHLLPPVGGAAGRQPLVCDLEDGHGRIE